MMTTITETTSKLPETTSKLPETTSKLPETTLKLPERITLPPATTTKPNIVSVNNNYTALTTHPNFYLLAGSHCGFGLVNRIAFGEEVAPGELPWLVMLRYRSKYIQVIIIYLFKQSLVIQNKIDFVYFIHKLS
jgi:hypothetical protein